MDCPRCGDPTDHSDRFCSTCGQDLVTYQNLWPRTQVQTPAPLDPAPSPAPRMAPTPGAPAPPRTEPVATSPKVQTYLTWAAALTALCWPAFWAGIPALVFAGRAESRLSEGDLTGARQYAEKAKAWCWTTFIAGVALWTFALTLVVTL